MSQETYAGEFYFYYGLNEETGKYEYGSLPNYDMAKEAGLVQTVDKNAKPATPDQPTTTTPSNNNNTDPTKNTVPTAGLQTQFQLLTQQIAQTTAQFRQVLQQQLQFSQFSSLQAVQFFTHARDLNNLK